MKVTVLTDFSKTSHNAALYAALLTKQLPVKSLTLYHSEAVIPLTSDIPLQYYETAISKERITKKLTALKKDLQHSVDPSVEINYWTDGQPLISYINFIAEKEPENLVIIGTSVKTSLEKLLAENHTNTMISNCLTPLLIVPSNTHYKTIKNVTFACDLENVSETVPAEKIKKFIQYLKSKLFVLNVDHDEGKEFKSDLILEQTALHKLLDSINPEYYYEEGEDIVKGILKFVRDHDIQLLIISPKTYPLLERIFHHSISKELVANSAVPVLLLRNK